MIPYHLVHMGTSKHIAASHWWSGSSQQASHWSDPEQWPAEKATTQINVREALENRGFLI